jgi:hypothetical protein
MKALVLSFSLLTFSTFTACSHFFVSDESLEDQLQDYQVIDGEDYLSHYEYLGTVLKNTRNIRFLSLDKQSKEYLNRLIKQLTSVNSLFFKESLDYQLKVIKDKRPFHFSLPNRVIFMSTGLIQKYIKNESLLVGVLLYDIIKAEKGVFKKQLLYPKGFISIEDLVSFLRIDTDKKINIHKWTYYLMRRTPFDEEVYLFWLQTQNRSYLDFSLHLGDTSSIFKEEHKVKEFVIQNYRNKKSKRNFKNSSRGFYQFLNSLR